MRSEYQIALCRGTSISDVCRDLKDGAQKTYHRTLDSIETDRKGAELIRDGLSCPADSEAHKMAEAYIKDFRKVHEPKLRELDRLINKLMDKLDDDEEKTDPDDTNDRKDGADGDGAAAQTRSEK